MATEKEFKIDELKLSSSLSQKELDTVQLQLKQAFDDKEVELRKFKVDAQLKAKALEDVQTELNLVRVEKQKIQKQNDLYRERLNQSFTADELADYLNQTIATFNENASSNMTHAKYIINNVDVDLKAQLYTDELGNLRFSAPYQEGTTETMSSIKISICAIPNT